ncbi:MAG: tRNA uridine-5-carboxymethylaminomethyl(34) synthesis GTPase MnmE [Candidatus Coatesbacteria bacterium]|nr:MAG: tRNA uridine-5-carboxymethylaminomethyl(34) synthesis GTPase MnmE [Candidatus Coatesbacteria bacterium]
MSPPKMFRADDTIAALASPPGRGALALLRVSGPATRDLLAALFRAPAAVEPRRARLGELVHPHSGEVLDRAVVVFYEEPHSYTGEDLAEITVHAGPAVVEGALEALCDAGARPAEPGEFTWRAVANGKLDLTEAQAVADLAEARTAAARGEALRRLGGELSHRVNGLRERIVAARALAEASLEFQREVDVEEVLASTAAAERSARKLVASSRDRETLHRGLTVALAGPRNAGKSTLFNRLLGEDRAIVTPHPGTTTDRLEAPYLAGGFLFRLSDGAGLTARGGRGAVEREGIRRARAYLEEAALVIWLDDLTSPPPAEAPPVAPEKLIWAANKADLASHAGWGPADKSARFLRLSALTGEGVEVLTSALVSRARKAGGAAPEEGTLTLSARERRLLEEAGEGLARARDLIRARGIEELAAEELRLAAEALAKIVGEIGIEEIYGEIFSRFCIGK